MTSLTLISPGRRFRVPRAMHMSRSVTTPKTLPSLPTTGRNPQFPFHINSVAAPKFVSGWQQYGVAVISSLTFIGSPPLSLLRLHLANYFNGRLRVQSDSFCDAAHDDPVKSSAAVRPDNDHVRFPGFCLAQDDLVRPVLED